MTKPIAEILDEMQQRNNAATSDELRDDMLASCSDVPKLVEALRVAVAIVDDCYYRGTPAQKDDAHAASMKIQAILAKP